MLTARMRRGGGSHEHRTSVALRHGAGAGRQAAIVSGVYIVKPCGFSTAEAIPCPASLLLRSLTHTILGLEESFSGRDTLQGFFAQTKGPLCGSGRPALGPHSRSWRGKGGREEQARTSAEETRGGGAA